MIGRNKRLRKDENCIRMELLSNISSLVVWRNNVFCVFYPSIKTRPFEVNSASSLITLRNIPNYLVWIVSSWDRASKFYVNRCPTRCTYTQFVLSVNCCTCFGWSLHPSSGAQITVSTASVVVAVNTGLFKMIVEVLTTCHTQYTWNRSVCVFV